MRLIVHHAKNGVHAFNVLTGALRADPRTRELDIVFARDAAAIEAAIEPNTTVAWSFYSPEAHEIEAMRRSIARPALHIAGGVHATAEPLDTLRRGFDLVALGEGEKTIIDLTIALREGRDPLTVRGLARLENDAMVTSGRSEPIELDDYPAFNVVDRRFGALEITRGCVYACAFCQTPFMFKARFRHRSIGNVREHVRIMRRERLRYVRFVTPTSLSYGSDNTEPNLSAVEALLAAVREEIGHEGKIFFGTFPSEVRPEHVTKEALVLLRRYVDNDNLVIGGQSGSQRVLDRTRRDHSVEDVIRASRIAVENGFVPNVDFLFGLPEENASDHEATVRLMQRLSELGARVHSHTFMPLPGTPLRDAPPGSVAEPVARALMQLEAKGRAYGQWRAQVVSADRSSTTRPHVRPAAPSSRAVLRTASTRPARRDQNAHPMATPPFGRSFAPPPGRRSSTRYAAPARASSVKPEGVTSLVPRRGPTVRPSGNVRALISSPGSSVALRCVTSTDANTPKPSERPTK